LLQSAFRKLGPSGVVLAAAISVAGCATKDYVQQQVTPVEAEAQQAQGTAEDALRRANAAHKLAEGKFLYEVVLSDDSVKFPVNQYELSPEARARLEELAERLKTENRDVYLEIQGFTDGRGSPLYNEWLGQERAEAVRRFLHKQGVALNRMATISYGAEEPVASNDTPEGRAQNRRVTIVILS
jgi:outer membrane protein OmpA-like peptidoglycan-associated protein